MGYDPNEARDYHGRWTSDGSMAGDAARRFAGLAPVFMGDTLMEKMKSNGFSVSTAGKSPTTGYMVALSKETEQRFPMDTMTRLDIRRYAIAHWSELQKPNMYVGGWLTADKDGRAFGCLDCSENFQDWGKAVTAGWARGPQEEIYDLNLDKSIARKDWK